VGFNLEVGGYFSIKRNAVSIWGDTFIREDQAVAYCKALLEVFRCEYRVRVQVCMSACICPRGGTGRSGAAASDCSALGSSVSQQHV